MSKNTKPANKEVIAAAGTKAAPAAAIQTAAAPAKADKARAIFDECYAMPTVPARKDIIQRAVAEAGLTKAGAATYLQNYKTKKGLVVKKAATA